MSKTLSVFSDVSRRFRAAVGAFKRGWQQQWAKGEDTQPGGGSKLTNAAQQSAWVFRCLQLTSGPVRALELQWFARSGKAQQTPLNDPELAEFWSRPAVTASGALSFGDFVELTIDWVNIRGQAFWVLDDTWLTRGGVKSPLFLARADRLSAIKRGDELLGWRFTDGAGKGYNLLPQQVVRPRILNPFDDAAGLSPLDAAFMAASADYASGVFARNVAESNGDQGVYVISKSGTLDQTQREQIIAQLRQKSQLAKRGDFRAAFLTSDVTIEDPKLKTVDAAFVEGRKQSKYEIAVAFGVPPSMLDRMESYSVGAASDRYRLIEETCIPHADRIAETIAEVERVRTGRSLAARFDWSGNATLAQVRNERFKTAGEVWSKGVPWDVLNQTLALGMPSFPGSNRAWLPMSLEAVDNGGNDHHEEETQTPPEPETGDDTQKAFTQRGAALSEIKALLAKAAEDTDGKDGEDAKDTKRRALWEKHMKARGPSEKLFKSKFNKRLMAARSETLAKLAASEKNLGGVRERGVLDVIFDLSKFTIELQGDMGKAHKAALEEATNQFLLEIARPDDPWRMEGHDVLNFLSERENLMRDVAKEVHGTILTTLEEGLQKGESTAELAARVRGACNGIANERAVMVAATETGAAYGRARHAAIEGLDIPYKQWLSAQDDRVRDTHRRIDGTVVSYDEPFHVPTKDGGEDLMMHPCDSNGSAGNCIHCRCVELPMMEEDVPDE